MTLYALDTDHLSLILRGHPKVRERLTAVPPEEVVITIITAEEQLRGRLAQVSKAGSGEAPSKAYQYLHKAINDLARLTVLDYDASSDLIYHELRLRRLRVGSQDLRIAAISLANSAILVTCNHSDFSKVPGLVLDD